MKKRILTPMATLAVATTMLFGCASSNDNMDTTAMDNTTMSETQTMAGNDQMQTNTDNTTDMDMSTDMDYSTMFNDISDTKSYDIMALARTNPHLSTFVSLMDQSGLAADLNRAGASFTVFAPTNEAFQSLPKEKYDYLMDPQHKNDVIKILQAHVLPNKVMTSEMNETQRIETADGQYINISTNDMVGAKSPISVGDATIVKPDVEASNGVLHVVDAVIMPSETNVDPGIIR